MAASKGQERAGRPMIKLARGCFSAPSFAIFSSLLSGWVLVDRVRQPRAEAVPQCRGPAVLEGSGTGARGVGVAVALRGDPDLLHPNRRHRGELDRPALVSEEGEPKPP